MIGNLWSCLASVALAAAAFGDEPTAPAGPAPATGQAQLVGDVLIVQRGIVHQIPETRVGTRKVEDREEQYNYTGYRPQVHPEQVAISSEDYRIYDLNGKPVDPAAAAKRLEKATLVLFSDSGKKVDPRYLQIYKPGTLIIYLRPQMRHSPVMPVEPPVVAPGAPQA